MANPEFTCPREAGASKVAAMRIALLHYAAPPVVGGVEKIIAAHARLFRRAGQEVRIIAQEGEPDAVLGRGATAEEVKSALAGAELVLAHNVLTMPFDMGLTAALWEAAAELPAGRCVAWIHDIAPCNPHYRHDWHASPWRRLTEASPAFEYVAISPLRARQFEVLTGRAARVIPNGIEPAEFLRLTAPIAQLAAKHALLSRDIVLLHPTRLLQRKNVDFGLAVLAELRRRGRDAVLLITGASDPHNAESCNYAAKVRGLRAEFGLEESALIVADELSPPGASDGDIAALYALADALFFPSTQEGFGLPVLEAALCRLPIFCSDVEPLNALLNHSVHVFDPFGQAADVAHLVERTLEHAPSYRARREALREYAWEVIWERHLAPLLGGRP
jgi:glycosyltransferase involved in cell wall biosynthesis